MRSIPTQKTGSEFPIIDKIEDVVSRTPPRFCAAKIPTANPIAIDMISAVITNEKVVMRREPISSYMSLPVK
jgi:hypothetical protein